MMSPRPPLPIEPQDASRSTAKLKTIALRIVAPPHVRMSKFDAASVAFLPSVTDRASLFQSGISVRDLRPHAESLPQRFESPARHHRPAQHGRTRVDAEAALGPARRRDHDLSRVDPRLARRSAARARRLRLRAA